MLFLEKVIIVVENGFEDIELLYPYYRFQEAGYKVEVVGPKAKETYLGKKGGSIKSTAAPEDVNIDDYAAVIVPGGWAPDRMRTRPSMVKLVRDADERGLVIAAICHAAQLLVEADVVRGKWLLRDTQRRMRRRGIKFSDQHRPRVAAFYDNAGEDILELLHLEFLIRQGFNVIMIGRATHVLNDATGDELDKLMAVTTEKNMEARQQFRQPRVPLLFWQAG